MSNCLPFPNHRVHLWLLELCCSSFWFSVILFPFFVHPVFCVLYIVSVCELSILYCPFRFFLTFFFLIFKKINVKLRFNISSRLWFIIYSPILWYRWFYDTVYPCVISTNVSSPPFIKFNLNGTIGPRYAISIMKNEIFVPRVEFK